MSVLHFDVLVPENSRLRALPSVVEQTMRMRVDALVYAADAISSNWQRLKTCAIAIGANVDKLDHHGRAAMLSAAWSVVDELDAVRQLVESMIGPGDEVGPNTTNLLEACAPVRVLRNKLRHLAGNLKNIARVKGPRSALFGALSWMWCPDPKSGQAHVVIIQSGMLHGGESMQMVNPAGKDFAPPADLFQLDAFGVVLPLSDPILAFARWIDSSTADWIEQLEEKIKARVAAVGGDEAQLWKHSGAGFSVSLPFNFEPAAIL